MVTARSLSGTARGRLFTGPPTVVWVAVLLLGLVTAYGADVAVTRPHARSSTFAGTFAAGPLPAGAVSVPAIPAVSGVETSVTQKRVSGPPVTRMPGADAFVTEASARQAPASQAPETETPATERSAAEASATEAFGSAVDASEAGEGGSYDDGSRDGSSYGDVQKNPSGWDVPPPPVAQPPSTAVSRADVHPWPAVKHTVVQQI